MRDCFMNKKFPAYYLEYKMLKERLCYQSNFVSPHPPSVTFLKLIFVFAVYLSSDDKTSGTSSFLTFHRLVPNKPSNSSSGGNLTHISSPRASTGNVAMLTWSSLTHLPPPASLSEVK